MDDDPLLIPPPLRSREPQTNRQAHPKPPPASAITSNQNSTVQPNENGKNPNQKQAEPQAQSQNSGKGKEKGGGKEAPSGGAMSKEVSLNSEKEGDNSIMVGSTSKVASNQVGSEKQNGNQAGTSTSNLSAPLPQTTSTSTPHSLPAQVQVSASPERNEAPISKAPQLNLSSNPGPSNPPATSAAPLDLSKIFLPDGNIVFPYSDGNPAFEAPNKVVPSASASKVNYYHVWREDDERSLRWKATVGSKLAEEFGLPATSSQRKPWKVKYFPKDYEFADHRTGDRVKPRTDPYLYGEFLQKENWKGQTF